MLSREVVISATLEHLSLCALAMPVPSRLMVASHVKESAVSEIVTSLAGRVTANGIAIVGAISSIRPVSTKV